MIIYSLLICISLVCFPWYFGDVILITLSCLYQTSDQILMCRDYSYILYGGTFMAYSAYRDTFIILSWTVMFAEKCYRWGFSILWLPLCTNGYLSLCICLIIVIHDCLLYFLYSRLMPLLPVNRSSHINTSSNPNHLSPHPHIILCSNRHPGGSLIQLQIRSLQSKVSQHTYIHIHIHTYIYIYIYIYIYSPATLLDTPLQLLGNTNYQSANHMAATQYI